jgi:hypothetical protein
VLKSSESSAASALATGAADVAGEGPTGCRVIGALFLFSVFFGAPFLPNSEKNTKNYPPPENLLATHMSVSLYHFARYRATREPPR